MTMTNPPTKDEFEQHPHEELFMECKKKAGDSVWAVAMSADEEGRPIWYVYCANKRKLKKLPKDFNGQPVEAVHCQKPNLEQ